MLSLCFGLSVVTVGHSSDSRFVVPELDEARDRAKILVWQAKALYDLNSPDLERLRELYEITLERFDELIFETAISNHDIGWLSEVYDRAYGVFDYFEEYAIKIINAEAGPTEQVAIPVEPLRSVDFEKLRAFRQPPHIPMAQRTSFLVTHSWDSWFNIGASKRVSPVG